MSGNNPAVIVHEHRNRPAPLANRGRNLRHLLVAVRPGVSGIRNKAGDGFSLNFVGRLLFHSTPSMLRFMVCELVPCRPPNGFASTPLPYAACARRWWPSCIRLVVPHDVQDVATLGALWACERGEPHINFPDHERGMFLPVGICLVMSQRLVL